MSPSWESVLPQLSRLGSPRSKEWRSGVRRIFSCITAGLVSGLWLLSAGDAPGPTGAGTVKAAPAENGAGNYGTSVRFERTPALAARQALKEGKLVFVLHVSGPFEDPDPVC